MASFQRILFKSIDILFNRAQNKHKFAGINIKKDIVFDEECPTVCALDVYRHEDKIGFKLPAIINFHGGGYMAGDKMYRSGIASFLVDKLDICVINVNYHNCDETYKFPQFTRDSMKALAYIETHADELNIDLDNLYVMGDSAGAQIAAHAITIMRSEEMREGLGCVSANLKFKAALLFCGPYDVLTAMTSPSILDIARGLGNKVLGINVRKGELEDYPLKRYLNLLDWIPDDFPPAFIGHTKYDVFCAGQGDRLITELKKRNIPYVSYYSTKRWDYHCWYLALKDRSAKKLLAELVKYMQSMLKGEIPPVQEIVYGKPDKVEPASDTKSKAVAEEKKE